MNLMNKRILALIFSLTAFLVKPGSVLACAVCGFGEDSRAAFISTTALMTFVPLILIGGFIYWIYRRAQSAEYNKNIDQCDGSDGSASVSSAN